MIVQDEMIATLKDKIEELKESNYMNNDQKEGAEGRLSTIEESFNKGPRGGANFRVCEWLGIQCRICGRNVLFRIGLTGASDNRICIWW